MIEGVEARERPESGGRCPYCHEVILPGATVATDARVDCDACAAPHHAECFVELGRCAATGCGSHEVRAGFGVILGAAGLAERCEAGDLTIEVAPPSNAVSWAALVWGFAAAGLLGSVVASGGTFTPFVIAIACFVIVIPLVVPVFFRARGKPSIRVDTAERPLDYGTGNLVPWHGSATPRDLLREQFGEAPTAVLPEPDQLPSQCPSCRGQLERAPGGDTVAFCYHCGASLT